MKRLFASILLILGSIAANAQFRDPLISDLSLGETAREMKSRIQMLSSAAMEGRRAGSEGEAAAAAYTGSDEAPDSGAAAYSTGSFIFPVESYSCISSRFGERIHLFGIRLEELVVGDGAGTGVGHVGTHRARLVGGSHRTSHPPGMLVAGEFIGHLTCQPCPLKGDGTGEVGQLVVGL